MIQLAILSAFGGKLESEVIDIGQGKLQYNLPVLNWYQKFPAAAHLDPSQIFATSHIVSFEFEGKYKKISLLDAHTKSVESCKLMQKYAAQLQNVMFYTPSYIQVIEVPILEMQAPLPSHEPAKPQQLSTEAKALLKDLYVALVAEAEVDAFSEESEKFAKPLAEKIRKLNKILQFHEEAPEFGKSLLEDAFMELEKSFTQKYMNGPLEKMTKALDEMAQATDEATKKKIASAFAVPESYLSTKGYDQFEDYLDFGFSKKLVMLSPADKEKLDKVFSDVKALGGLAIKTSEFVEPGKAYIITPEGKKNYLGEFTNMKIMTEENADKTK